MFHVKHPFLFFPHPVQIVYSTKYYFLSDPFSFLSPCFCTFSNPAPSGWDAFHCTVYQALTAHHPRIVIRGSGVDSFLPVAYGVVLGLSEVIMSIEFKGKKRWFVCFKCKDRQGSFSKRAEDVFLFSFASAEVPRNAQTVDCPFCGSPVSIFRG